MQAEQGRVLVVVGDQLRRDRLRRQIEESGFAVISTGSTDEAAALVRDEEPDVVVIDALRGSRPERRVCCSSCRPSQPPRRFR